MKTYHKRPDNGTDAVFRKPDSNQSMVSRDGETGPTLTCVTTYVDDGFIVRFLPEYHASESYVCVSSAQARNLVLALSAFKTELGFE